MPTVEELVFGFDSKAAELERQRIKDLEIPAPTPVSPAVGSPTVSPADDSISLG
jgi:hypothetical protein